MKKKIKPLYIIFAIQLIIILISICNFFLCKSSLFSTIIYPNEMEYDAVLMHEDKISVNTSNAKAGIVAETVPLALDRGHYIVYVNYSTDTNGNKIQAYSPDIPAHNFCSNPNTLIIPNKTSVLSIRINSPGEVIISIEYCGEGSIEISELSIYETTDIAKQDFWHALFFCLILSFGYYMFTTTLSKRNICMSLCSIVLLSSFPLFTDYLLIGHDVIFHMLRIEGIKQGLQYNIFPVKIYPMLASDYGYASGVFYGDILLYFPALLRRFGMTIQSAYQVFAVVINIASTLISYYCFKNLFNSKKWGLVGTLLYMLSLYRLINVYTRAAVGEYCAMMFLPILFLGLYRIFTQKNDKFDWKIIIMPAIGLSGIINTHILSCIMVAIFILLTCIILIKKTIKPRIFLSLLLTVILVLFINAGFLVPFIDYYFTEDFLINSSEWGGTSVENFGLYLVQIFSIFQRGSGGTSSTLAGIANEFTPGFGLTLTIGFFVCLYYLITSTNEERKNASFKLIAFCMICTVLSICMTSYLFPWDSIASSSKLGESLVSSLQFPWRFLSLGTLFLSICFCQVLKQLSERKNINNVLPFVPVTIILLCACTIINSGWYYHSYFTDNKPYRVFDSYEIPSIQLYTCEYLPADTELGYLSYGRYDASQGIHIASLTKEGTSIQANIHNYGADGYLEVPILNYKGYTAVNLDTNSEMTISNGFNNCIRVDIPAEFNGNLEISFKEPVYWRIAEIISAVTVISLLAIFIIKYINKRKLVSD